ncbi:MULTISPECIES: polymer-forming cytoskeletal protein [Vibrio]|uniref:Polymer-forming cytoskeletal family protein n=1 Tax=Vibrio mediterranei TaxID=689 RepID=A0A3G4VGQ5_9VIBR|nr:MULTISPECIES: polymer-forming cytoskeletal protein [Vibrio]AYV23943.1 polymer-forming cytoskeletal family protein [Vibrio mediterranei]MCF4173625.1 polymer-forming cytoskeletal protein [Vibrio sp. McD22-P3]MDA0107005.1 polymer-forming cytoskeletal protein [Vibrio sp. La 4.2.2]NUW74277.1 polymer-forming cytoskeletal protein [Vibrio mediterranei]USE02817.1 polymer-forming cytoskeletal protein [Vibrio sp. SCSIO 43133]|eukprot:TRINITY_DN4122_c0_g1_i1.p1 TRINITY_DN4122_c0_g1~~TRINITY_DN4122_c0_g1_i1.p1  ORF type:complete len:151 (-),score=10.33 TRINITY_DN4122_c0_g1_i1:36-488(-)
MGIFSKNSGTKSRSAAATLIAKGCTISGKLKLESDIQVDGIVDGQVHVEGSLVVAESGRVKGEIFAKQLIVNGIVEGNCHAEHIQILANGRVKGKVWSNNLSIEPGGKFFGETAEFPDDEVVSLKSKETTETKLPINPKSGPKNDIKKSA